MVVPPTLMMKGTTLKPQSKKGPVMKMVYLQPSPRPEEVTGRFTC